MPDKRWLRWCSCFWYCHTAQCVVQQQGLAVYLLWAPPDGVEGWVKILVSLEGAVRENLGEWVGKLIPKAAVTRKCPELLLTTTGNLLGHLNCRFQMLIWVLLKKAHDGRFNFSIFYLPYIWNEDKHNDYLSGCCEDNTSRAPQRIICTQ